MNSFKIALCVFLFTPVLFACGGGGGNSDKKPTSDNNEPPTSYRPPSVPLDENQCTANSDYQWLNDDCTLAGNTKVRHVEQINNLPETDRKALINWLTSIEKKANLESMMPEAFSSSGASVISAPIVLDQGLIQEKHTNTNFLSTDDGALVFGNIGVKNRLFEESHSKKVNISGLPEFEIEAKIVLGNGLAYVSLNDHELYQFKYIDSLAIEAHIGAQNKTNSSDTLSSSLKPEIYSPKPNILIRSNTFLPLIKQAISPDITSKTALQQTLELSDEFMGSQVDFSDWNTTRLLARITVEGETTPFFNRRNNTESIYLNHTKADTLFTKSEYQVDAEVVLRSISLDDFPQHQGKQLIYFTGEYNTESESDLESPYYQLKVNFSTSDDYTMVPVDSEQNPYSAMDELEYRITQMISSGERSLYTADAWRAFPGLSQAVSTVLPLTTDAAALVKQISANTKMRDNLLELASPYYYSLDGEPSPSQIKETLTWTDDLASLLNLSLDNIDADNPAPEDYAIALDHWLKAMPNDSFYNDLSHTLNTIFLELNANLLDNYSEQLVASYIELAYHKLLFDNALPSTTELKEAFTVAGEAYASPLNSELMSLGVPLLGSSQWKINEQSSLAIRNTPEILSAENKAAIDQHDAIASIYNIANIKNKVFDIYHEHGSISEYLDKKNSVLADLSSFLEVDVNNMENELDFRRGESILASLAYEENWRSIQYDDLSKVKIFFFPRYLVTIPSCEKASLTEWLKCANTYSSILKRYSTVNGIGYLASYDGVKPYVNNADVFAEMENIIAEIYTLQGSLIYPLSLYQDYIRALEDGIWMSCSATTIESNIQLAKQKLDHFYSLVQADNNPRIYSDSYDQQKAVRDEIENLLKECPAD